MASPRLWVVASRRSLALHLQESPATMPVGIGGVAPTLFTLAARNATASTARTIHVPVPDEPQYVVVAGPLHRDGSADNDEGHRHSGYRKRPVPPWLAGVVENRRVVVAPIGRGARVPGLPTASRTGACGHALAQIPEPRGLMCISGMPRRSRRCPVRKVDAFAEIDSRLRREPDDRVRTFLR